MEILLLLIALIGIVAFIFWTKRPDSDKTWGSDNDKTWSSDRDKTWPRQATSSNNTQPKRRPFDGQSAKPLPTKPVLQGSAYVVDGDTLVIQKTQIRLFGVDAPELNHPYGNKAKWALVALCKGQTVRAELSEQDVHGRTVARCYLQDGRDVSAEMVKVGLAIDWTKFSGGEYLSLEVPGVRKKLWLADARQKGHMHVWEKFEATRSVRAAKK